MFSDKSIVDLVSNNPRAKHVELSWQVITSDNTPALSHINAIATQANFPPLSQDLPDF